MKRSLSIEFLIITLVGLLYFTLCAPLPPPANPSSVALNLEPIAQLILDPTIRPAGIEHERLSGVILPIRIGLQRYSHIPFWNSYLSNGVPLINNAFNYLFNPFHSLPVLLLGAVTGSKLAILIALLIAGYNMWALGYVIGLGAVPRVTIAALYMVNGSLTAKFGAGHFQLACSLAWPPLVIAALWWTLHSPKRIAPVVFGISFALLFYAGNIYYALHTLICCLVIVAAHLLDRFQGRWHFRRDRLLRAVIAASLAFGFSALQFFPVWQTRDFVTHDAQGINADGTLVASYDVAQAVTNLTQPWQVWTQIHPPQLFDAVDYAYIGSLAAMFVGLGFALALISRLWRKQALLRPHPYTRLIIIAVLLALFMMFWAGGQVQPIPWLYTHIPLLAQFRYLGRALAIAALWWLVLGGIALDVLWKATIQYLTTQPTAAVRIRNSFLWLACLAIGLWLFWLVYSAAPAATRIALMLRNLQAWQWLDMVRFTSIAAALLGLIHLLIIAAVLNGLLHITRHLLTRSPAQPTHFWLSLTAYGFQIVLLSLTAFGLLDVMTTNVNALQFRSISASFAPIYDDIHRLDSTKPFAAVSIPFSPLTFDAYESEMRLWSLNEGWLPAAPPKSVITMGQFSNFPRWLVANRDVNGTILDQRVQTFVRDNRYERRACYRHDDDSTQRLADCTAFVVGVDLYERPQTLPYAFVVAESDLTNNPTTLRLDAVKPATVLLYQQDRMVISTSTSSTARQFLVIQEASFPGWQVTIDGLPVQPVTVPTLYVGKQTLGLLAVPIEKGNHTVTLHFDPPGFAVGVLVFLATLALTTLYLSYRRKQKSPA